MKNIFIRFKNGYKPFEVEIEEENIIYKGGLLIITNLDEIKYYTNTIVINYKVKRKIETIIFDLNNIETFTIN